MMGLTSRPVGNASRWSRNHLSELYGKFFLDMREGLRRRLTRLLGAERLSRQG